MVKLELRRDRIVARWGEKKSEWVIEPRYWRNPIIGIGALFLLPLLVQPFPHILTMITTANLYAAIAIPLGLQMLGTARVNFGPQLYLGIGGYTAALLNLHFGLPPTATLAATILVCGALALLLSPTTWIAKGLYFSLITLILPLTFLDITFIWGGRLPRRGGFGGDESPGVVPEGFLELSVLLLPVASVDAPVPPRL